jgi:hypothetical protein
MFITANGVDVIKHAKWASWRASRAKGHGVVYADNCKPNCAEGHYRKDPATITLLKPHASCGKRFFFTMHLHYTGKKFPAGINRHQDYSTQPDSCDGTVALRPAASKPGVRRAHELPRVLSCTSTPRSKPEDAVVTCSDGSLSWRRVKWSTWNAHHASGKGQVYVNDCKPKCVSGHFRRYPAKVSLAKVHKTNHRGPVFAQATISYSVSGAHQSVTKSLLAGRHQAKPQLKGGEFFSPLGNMTCEVDNYPGLRQALCGRHQPISSVTLSPSGAITRCSGLPCGGDAAENTPTLHFGKTDVLGPFRCLSSTSGVLCTVKKGSGFLLSKSRTERILGY